MRNVFLGTEPVTRIEQPVADETALAAIGNKLLRTGAVATLTSGVGLWIYRATSLAAAKAGAVVVPNVVSSSAAYAADPITAPGRWENLLAPIAAPPMLYADYALDANFAGTRTGNVLLATGNGTLTVDGTVMTVGKLVLLTNQTTGADNGLYQVTAAGAVGSKVKLQRATNADASSEFVTGQTVYVISGIAYAGARFDLATTGAITLNSTTLTYKVRQASHYHDVRGVVTSNTSLSAFAGVTGGTPVDGVTYIQGDRVLLAGQSTPAQNGIYVVGVVAAGVAPLYRAADWSLVGPVQSSAATIRASEGTTWAGKEWFPSTVGGITVGTTDPAFYPKRYSATTTALAGTPGIKAVSSQWILHATNSRVLLSVKTPGGAQGFLSYGTLVAGAGTGSFTITSTANETSTVAYEIINA